MSHSRATDIPKSNLSGRLKNDENHISTSLKAEDERCISLPGSALRDQHWMKLQQSDRTPVCSSSCENLIASNAAADDDNSSIGRLSKASSDNPLYNNTGPPIPPRDYLPYTGHKPHKAEIHPVVQDGEKKSNTHYWLLPDKQQPVKLNPPDVLKEDYVNITKKPEKSNSTKITDSKKQSTKRESPRKCDTNDETPLLLDCGDSISIDEQCDILTIHHHQSRDTWDTHHSTRGGLDTSAARHNLEVEDHEERATSMSEAKDMIDVVKSEVEGVTCDECVAALAIHQWNTESAVKYLKVENLFRLGLATRDKCRNLLERNGWELETAASDLLDQVSRS